MQMAKIEIGTVVRNLGVEGVVIGYHDKTGDPILKGDGNLRWVADPDKCEVLQSMIRHRDGLVLAG